MELAGNRFPERGGQVGHFFTPKMRRDPNLALSILTAWCQESWTQADAGLSVSGLASSTSSRWETDLRGWGRKLGVRWAMASFSRLSSLRIWPRAWSAQGPFLSRRT